jgi:hypothetical protein
MGVGVGGWGGGSTPNLGWGKGVLAVLLFKTFSYFAGLFLSFVFLRARALILIMYAFLHQHLRFWGHCSKSRFYLFSTFSIFVFWRNSIKLQKFYEIHRNSRDFTQIHENSRPKYDPALQSTIQPCKVRSSPRIQPCKVRSSPAKYDPALESTTQP